MWVIVRAWFYLQNLQIADMLRTFPPYEGVPKQKLANYFQQKSWENWPSISDSNKRLKALWSEIISQPKF